MTTLQELTRVELTAILCSDVNSATRREAADALYFLGHDTGYDRGLDDAKELADKAMLRLIASFGKSAEVGHV